MLKAHKFHVKFTVHTIMYFRDGKFFTHRHSDTYDSGIEFYKPVEN